MFTRRGHAAVAVVAVVAMAGCARDTHTAAWPDLVTARQQDAIERGWIPAFLPEDARDLRQRNDPESGAGIVVATMPADVALPECGGDAPVPAAPPLDAPWWPEVAVQDAAPCRDGWFLHRTGDRLALWTTGALEPSSDASEAS
jgi:hypothetical protein